MRLYQAKLESEVLFVVTLGSQEGAFENVRMTYAGEHGAHIKQLVLTHALRRTSICCLATRRRKHLMVTHEKGKASHFTVLQLNALLKQDSNKKNKLTLTKLNTIPVPFTLLSVVANQHNEDYLALVGLKDCHVMYLNEHGQTRHDHPATTALPPPPPPPTPTPNQTEATAALTTTTPTQHKVTQQQQQQQPQLVHDSASLIALHVSLDASNYIIKCVSLPGSRTELALLTADFVKVYDLSLDRISPVYFFQLPMGKMRDVTFVHDEVTPSSSSSRGVDTVELSEEIAIGAPYKSTS